MSVECRSILIKLVQKSERKFHSSHSSLMFIELVKLSKIRESPDRHIRCRDCVCWPSCYGWTFIIFIIDWNLNTRHHIGRWRVHSTVAKPTLSADLDMLEVARCVAIHSSSRSNINIISSYRSRHKLNFPLFMNFPNFCSNFSIILENFSHGAVPFWIRHEIVR